MIQINRQKIVDISIKCVDRMVEKGIIKDCIDTDNNIEFDVQDIITDVLCDYFKINEPKNIPDASSIGAIRINLDDDEVSRIENGQIKLKYPYSIIKNDDYISTNYELWIWEQDKEKAEVDFG